jgi:threonyl-tRNA synthetase
LIEHFAGAFPVWMSPVQVAIIPVSGEHHKAYAETIFTALKEIEVRTELLLDDSLGKRIRNAKVKKIPYQIIIGDTEQENNTVTVEGRNDVKLAGISLDTFMTKITQEITNRTL